MRPDELEAAVEAGTFPEPLALFRGEEVTHRWQPSAIREFLANRPAPPAEQPPADEGYDPPPWAARPEDI
jgi:hypothetical protein